MLKLEDSFVDGSFVIPGQGSEESNQREGQNIELVDKGPEITRKHGVSAGNVPRVAFADLDVNADKRKK